MTEPLAEQLRDDAEILFDVDMPRFGALNRQAADRLDALETALGRAINVVSYVSMGRGYVGVKPYPDALARAVNAELRELGLAAGRATEGQP